MLERPTLAHGAFGDGLHRAFRLLDVEQIIPHAVRLDLPQHGEIDVDDVLVAGQHEALFRHVACGGAAAEILHDAHADVDLVDAQGLGREHRLDRIRQVIVQSGLHLAHIFAEAQHHAEFVGVDTEEAGESPDGDRGEHDQHHPLAAETSRQDRA